MTYTIIRHIKIIEIIKYISLYFIIFIIALSCSKDSTESESGSPLFLEKLNNTTWRHQLPINDPGTVDFNKDGIGDILLRSFLNTTNLNDIVFYRDISDLNEGETFGGYCANINDRINLTIVNHTQSKFVFRKDYNEDLDGNGITDSSTIEYSIINENTIRRRVIREDNSVFWNHTLSRTNLTYEENYKRCGYIVSRFRGRF